MKIFWNENLEILKIKNPHLYEKVRNHIPEDVGEVIPTQSVPNLRLDSPEGTFIYNRNDPIGNLNKSVSLLTKEGSMDQAICVFTGMGLGYVQLAVLENRKDLFKMIILEPCLDIFILALRYVDLRPLLASDKVHVLAGDIDWEVFNSIITDKGFKTDFHFSDWLPLVNWRPELYTDVKTKATACASGSISAYGVLSKFGPLLFDNRMSNLTLLRDANLLDDLNGAFKDRPAILISAGPSLGKSFDQLKAAKGRAVLIAVDSAVAPLLEQGIVPDIVTTLDFRTLNSEKLSPDKIGQANFSLVTNISASDLAIKRLAVDHLFYSFQENDTQEWLMHELNVEQKVPPGNSVALLALSVARIIQADPIVFLGYDFALTATEADHVQGAVFSYTWHQAKNQIQVKGVDGQPVNTLNFLNTFRHDIETSIKKVPGTYINATAAGAHIKGTLVRELGSVVKDVLVEMVPAQKIINGCARSGKHTPENMASLIEAARHQLDIANKTQRHVSSLAKQNDKVKAFLRKNKKQAQEIDHISKLPKNIVSARQKREVLYSEFKPFIPVEEVAAKKLEKAIRIHKTRFVTSQFDQLKKETEVMGGAMEGHLEGGAAFKRHVGNLIVYWETEDRILIKIREENASEKDIVTLVTLYLENSDAAKAMALLENHHMAYPDSAVLHMLMGECHALLLDFDHAFTVWKEAENKDPKLKKEIIRKKKKLGAYWVQRGLDEPLIVVTCLERGFRLYNERKFYLQQKKKAWPHCHPLIKQFIDNDELEKARSCLFLWEPIKDAIPEWGALYNSASGESD